MKDKIPDFQTLMFPTLECLKDDKPHTLSDVLLYLQNKFELSDEELSLRVPSGQQPLFKNRVTWALSYLKNAGLISTVSRGVYKITLNGQSVFNDQIDYINIAYLKKFDSFKSWQGSFNAPEEKGKNDINISEEVTPDEIIGVNIRKVNDKLITELLEVIKQITASQFELFVLKLLSRMGYGGTDKRNFEVVGKSGDNGIDGIIYQDKLGIDRIYVQAKKWTDNKVQSKDVRDFIGSLSLRGTTKGVFITTSAFTEDALKTVQMNPQNNIILIDGKSLSEYAVQFDIGVQVKERYEVKTLDHEFFQEL